MAKIEKLPVKRGPGRPKKLGPAHIVSIKKDLKKRDAKIVHIAAAYGVSVSTLRRNLPDYASFMRAA